ncbi:MAG: GFA family protein [Rhizobiaceae bacterium]|nr:GFA family protein [Rhizobiaceae bacterium]
MLTGSCHCGRVTWRFDAAPEGATACNCTVCRRYGALWIYGHEGEDVSIAGETRAYERGENRVLAFHFCPACACVVAWRGIPEDGRRRMAVNVRLAEPETVADIPIDHFDGLHSFDDLPRDGRRVKDYWF